jgi:hypothetical protein
MSEMDSLKERVESKMSLDMARLEATKYHDNTEAHNKFFDLVEKPIEPGLVLVMLELQRLSKEDFNKYNLLHDWLVEKLGDTYHYVHIASGYAQDEHNEITKTDGCYKVRREYLEALAKPNEKIYC